MARQTRRVLVMEDGRIAREDVIGSPLEEDLKIWQHSGLGRLLAAGETPDLRAMHAGANQAPKVPEVKVEKAKGANAQTVAGIVAGAPKLKDKPVTVRGQVVKFSSGIMGKNWLHLRDGTGSSRDGTDDLIVVTNDSTSVGEVVLVSGTVRTDRDLGMGYSYKVLVEDARLAK